MARGRAWEEKLINLRQLRYFAKVVEVGNITKAAELLYVAQPALGLQIRSLEADLQVPLLLRHSRGVTATPAGELLYRRACEILRAVEETGREVSAFGKTSLENVTLGLTPGVMKLIGHDVMTEAKLKLPKMNLCLVEELSHILIDALEREEIDVAVAYEVPERQGLIRIPLIEEDLMLMVSGKSSFDINEPLMLVDVLQFPLAMADGRDGVRRKLDSAAERLAIEPNVVYEATSISLMKSLAASGEAASIMPYGSAIDEIERGEIKAFRVADLAMKRTLYSVRSSRRAPFQNEPELMDFINRSVAKFADRMGELVTRLPALKESVAELA